MEFQEKMLLRFTDLDDQKHQKSKFQNNSKQFVLEFIKHLNFSFETSIWCCQILIASKWRKVSKITKVLTNLSFK
jgi:hypothetical protein